ncbi:MAG: hypothetical protein JWM36_2096 [Hyphomicrobiales bacterium]|nr:hypothetical protein [Hyphomicrobiales bacterium]
MKVCAARAEDCISPALWTELGVLLSERVENASGWPRTRSGLKWLQEMSAPLRCLEGCVEELICA